MDNRIKKYRIQLNMRARGIIELLIEQNPGEVYWTVSELFNEFKKEGFNSKKDMSLSLKALGIIQRSLWINGKASRYYLLDKNFMLSKK